MTDDYGCKVCRVLAERELGHYDERLLTEWRGEEGARKGYRSLAEWLNVTLLRREMDAAGLATLGDEAESKYERLRADDATAREVARLLERDGVDVAALKADFVSYGVVRTHITDCLGAEYEPTAAGDWERETIDIATDRACEKVRKVVGSLRRKGDLDGGESVAVHLDADVECEDCHTRVPLRRALGRGHICQCRNAAGVTSDD